MVKSQKGYSLVEIGVGILILTVFLICSVALFNGCYNTYRMIQQRNLAINYAVSTMEEMLQTDADILTGYFISELDETTNQYVLKANTEFRDFVENNFDGGFIERYAQLNQVSIDSVGTLSDEQYESYIYEDKNYLIGAYIKDVVENFTEEEYNSENVRNGDYALLYPSITYEGTQITLNDDTQIQDYTDSLAIIASGDKLIIPNNENNMIIKKTITRLPINDDREVFGNQVLKIKVEVFFTNRINNEGATEEDLRSVKIESIKVASNS